MMRRTILLAVAALLAAAAGARASDPVGIYALLDKVVLEPNDQAPERVRLWGVFYQTSRSVPDQARAARGYLYFAAVPGKEDVCRREWADLKRLAGGGDVAAFGFIKAAFPVRKPRPKAEPDAPADAGRLAAWIADLDSDQFSLREQATRSLERQGSAAYPALRKALGGKLSVEARKRVERLLAAETPEPYPLGFGVVRLEGEGNRNWREMLLSLPEPAEPNDGDLVPPGKVALRVKNLPKTAHRTAGYIFEIEGGDGQKEASPVVQAGDKVTEWTPRLEIKPGQWYTWRVRAVDGQWQGPPASASFLAKGAR